VSLQLPLCRGLLPPLPAHLRPATPAQAALTGYPCPCSAPAQVHAHPHVHLGGFVRAGGECWWL